MPRNCIYPQNTDVNEFLDDGFSPNPARCPYRTRWKPYTTPANNRCCQKAHVPIQGYGGVPATHVNFSDERPPRRPLALQNPKSCINQNESACYRNRRCNYDENHNVCEPMKWKPNQNCPGGSICGTCVPKNGPSDPRARECSDKYRCVLKDGAAWRRSCKGDVPGSPQHDEEESKVKEVWKPPIKKVTHRRKGCNEFPELNGGEPEPRGWCPVQRCYRHTEAGKRVCRSAPPLPSPSLPPQLFPAPPLSSLPSVYPIEEGDVPDDPIGEYSDSEDEEVELTDLEDEEEEDAFIPELDPCRSYNVVSECWHHQIASIIPEKGAQTST